MPSAERKLDIFPHIFPLEYFERMKRIAEGNAGLAAALKRWMHIPVLWDLERRIKMMKRWPGYQQVLTLSMPAIEFLGTENETPELARLANDGMAEIVERHPALFPCFVASLPMNNVQASLDEMDRAIGKLGAKGIQIFTNVNGRPLDDPEFFPIFERMTKKYDLPIWVHPTRTAKFADYASEQKSKYEIWWLFGWPYETSAFMARVVFSQMFEGLLKRMAKRPVEYFKMFYGDTSVNGAASAIRCGLDFYGVGNVLFGTDCPFDPQGGPLFIRETIKALDGMKLKPDERRKIYFGNAMNMLR